MPGNIVLVTGGSGLVGQGIEYVTDNEAVGSKYGKKTEDEQWIFLTSKDGDLRCVQVLLPSYLSALGVLKPAMGLSCCGVGLWGDGNGIGI